MFIILILSVQLLQNILFLEGTGTILKRSPKSLKTSECVRIGQYCTEPLTSFCVVFIKTFWTFLPLQNIYFEKGTPKEAWSCSFSINSTIFGPMSPGFNTEFWVNKNYQREFPSFREDPSKISCFDITLSNLNGFSSFFFEHACNVIPDIPVSLEYFISASAGDSLILLSARRPTTPIPMPSKQYFTQSIGFLLYTIIRLFWTFLSLQNILYQLGNKSLFAWRVFIPPKVNLVRFKKYCIVLLSYFLYTLLE